MTLGKVLLGPKKQKRRANIKKIILNMLYIEGQGRNYFGHDQQKNGCAN